MCNLYGKLTSWIDYKKYSFIPVQAVDSGQWSASRPCRFTPLNRVLCGPRAGCDVLEKISRLQLSGVGPRKVNCVIVVVTDSDVRLLWSSRWAVKQRRSRYVQEYRTWLQLDILTVSCINHVFPFWFQQLCMLLTCRFIDAVARTHTHTHTHTQCNPCDGRQLCRNVPRWQM